MPILLSKAVVDRFEREIEDRYKCDKEAVRGMRTLLERYEAGDLTAEVRAAMSGPDAKDLPLPPLEVPANAQTLASKVAEVCEQYANEQWTMRRMLAYLQQIDFPLSNKPEGSISSCLGKLAREKKLTVVRHGAGSSPSIYQWSAGLEGLPSEDQDSTSDKPKVDHDSSGESQNSES